MDAHVKALDQRYKKHLVTHADGRATRKKIPRTPLHLQTYCCESEPCFIRRKLLITPLSVMHQHNAPSDCYTPYLVQDNTVLYEVLYSHDWTPSPTQHTECISGNRRFRIGDHCQAGGRERMCSSRVRVSRARIVARHAGNPLMTPHCSTLTGCQRLEGRHSNGMTYPLADLRPLTA